MLPKCHCQCDTVPAAARRDSEVLGGNEVLGGEQLAPSVSQRSCCALAGGHGLSFWALPCLPWRGLFGLGPREDEAGGGFGVLLRVMEAWGAG